MLTPASVSDYRELARRRLPRLLFDYVDGGAFEEATLRANRADLHQLALKQKVMCDVSALDTSTTLFGQHLSMPLILAPVGFAGCGKAKLPRDLPATPGRGGVKRGRLTKPFWRSDEAIFQGA